MHHVIRLYYHAACYAQRTVKPGTHYRSAIDLGIQFCNASLTAYFSIWLDAEGWGIGVSTDDMEAGLAQRIASDVKGIYGRIVLRDIEFLACFHFSQSLSCIYPLVAGGFKAACRFLYCKKIDGRSVEKVNKVCRVIHRW